MYKGKKKAVTFSYDDGVTQDIRLIRLFDKYAVKATFNLNSDRFGREEPISWEGRSAQHNTVRAEDVKHIYEGHEVAGHTLTHPNLTALGEPEIIRQVEEDRQRLSQLAGYEVAGMAYPGGGVNCDDRVERVIREHTGIRYGRTGNASHSFAPQENLLRFRPTVHHHCEWEKMHALAEEFLTLEAEEPALLYIWGHSYEFDFYDQWKEFEEFLEHISRRTDIFYGTNAQVLLETE